MEALNVVHIVVEIAILGAVVVTARKMARLELMVELMWIEYQNKKGEE